MPIIEYKGKIPQVDVGAFIMNSAMLIGDVAISDKVLILSNTVLRGDFNRIYIGEDVCIQENSVLNPTWKEPIIIEGDSIIGYGTKVHGGKIGKGAFIGANCIILQGVRIGENSLIAAGSILTEDLVIPPRSLVAGVPAKVMRELRDEDIEWINRGVTAYRDMLKEYKANLRHQEIRYGTSHHE
jgi:phenylacetic acid degradation protein